MKSLFFPDLSPTVRRVPPPPLGVLKHDMKTPSKPYYSHQLDRWVSGPGILPSPVFTYPTPFRGASKWQCCHLPTPRNLRDFASIMMKPLRGKGQFLTPGRRNQCEEMSSLFFNGSGSDHMPDGLFEIWTRLQKF